MQQHRGHEEGLSFDKRETRMELLEEGERKVRK